MVLGRPCTACWCCAAPMLQAAGSHQLLEATAAPPTTTQPWLCASAGLVGWCDEEVSASSKHGAMQRTHGHPQRGVCLRSSPSQLPWCCQCCAAAGRRVRSYLETVIAGGEQHQGCLPRKANKYARAQLCQPASLRQRVCWPVTKAEG